MRIICIYTSVVKLNGIGIISLFLRHIYPSHSIIIGRKGKDSGKTKRTGKLIRDSGRKRNMIRIKMNHGGRYLILTTNQFRWRYVSGD